MYLQSNTRGAAGSERAIKQLDPTVKVRNTGITNFGAVAEASGQSNSVGMPSSINFTLDNGSGGTTKAYRIGDPDDWAVAQAGFTGTVQPDRSSGISGAAFAKAVSYAPMAVAGMSYSSTSGAVQFGSPFYFVESEVSGAALKTPINVAEFQRNTAQNDNLITMAFATPFVLDWNTGFYILVQANQVVNITLMFGAAGNR